jgi:hypothetical protein
VRDLKYYLNEACFILLLLGLGFLQLGWILWPSIGTAWNFINGGIITGIMIFGLLYTIFRIIKEKISNKSGEL